MIWYMIYDMIDMIYDMIYLLTAIRLTGRAVAVAGSIPDGVIGIFQWHNPSGRTTALGSTQQSRHMPGVAQRIPGR
jgi:hypothetical protein